MNKIFYSMIVGLSFFGTVSAKMVEVPGCQLKQSIDVDNLKEIGSIPIKNSESSGLEKVLQANIDKVRDAYAQEVNRELPVKIFAGTTAALAVGAIIYKNYWSGQQVELPSHKQMAYNIACNTHNIQLIGLQKFPEQGAETWGSWGKRNAYNIGTTVAFNGCLGIVFQQIAYIKSLLPESGDLRWFILNRTTFETTLNTCKRYLRFEVMRKSLEVTVPILVADIENICGYLEHFESTLTEKQLSLKKLIAVITKRLVSLTNQVIEQLNQKEKLDVVQYSLFEIGEEVKSAMDLVEKYR